MNAAAQVSSARKLFALLGITIGAAGFTASLTGTYLGMRDFMSSGSAFCATGGPYEIATECPQGALLMGASIFGLFVFGGVYALATASVKGPVLASSLVMWGVLFALLGWNFMDYGVFNSTSDGIVWGWAVPGVVFWLMAMGGLVPAAVMAVRWMIHPDEPEQPVWNPPFVRAAVQTPPAGPTPSGPSASVPARLVLRPESSDQ